MDASQLSRVLIPGDCKVVIRIPSRSPLSYYTELC
jgi:hypothetical protein